MLIRLLRTHLAPHRRWIVAVVVFQAIQTTAVVVLPAINARIIDRGVLLGDTDLIRRLGLLMGAVALVQIVFAVAAVRCGARISAAFGRDVRNDLFGRVLDFSSREVEHFTAPSLITRITNDVQQVQMLVLMSANLLVAGPIMVIAGTVMAVRTDGPLSLLLLVSVPALVLAVGSVVVRLVPQFQQMQDRIDTVNRVLREQITGLRVVRAFVRERTEADRFAAANQDLTDTSLRAGLLLAWMVPTVMIVLNLSSVAAVWFGGLRIDAGELQVGQLVAFLTYLVQILMSVMMATFVAVMTPRAAVCAGRIQEVLDTDSTLVVSAHAVSELPERVDLELRGVEFAYPGAEEPVLTGIDLHARPGETVGIIGSTGAGKTTLIKLIPRLLEATAGQVLVGGVDVVELDPELLWSRIGLVPQRPFLFTGTVASNLRHGAPDATDEELWHALEVAQGADFVAAMPDGLDATITQGGTNVSGGQRQRLAIARSLVRRPAIHLFDDASSALDAGTDARLRAALVPETRDSVVLLVAQRVASIRHADRILVLEDGHQVGTGTHEELLADCSTYVEIVDSQVQREVPA